MRRISDTKLRKALAPTLDRVKEDRKLVIITRDRGKPAAVLMPLEEFASWAETLHLLRNPANAERLPESLGEFHRVTIKSARPLYSKSI